MVTGIGIIKHVSVHNHAGKPAILHVRARHLCVTVKVKAFLRRVCMCEVKAFFVDSSFSSTPGISHIMCFPPFILAPLFWTRTNLSQRVSSSEPMRDRSGKLCVGRQLFDLRERSFFAAGSGQRVFSKR